ncbi:MAG: DUF1295 domain-containing protein [Oligoflexia bacterium]|nr:DUF1295 domain-containing protein [Oligoflexia bacterium]MBF0367530.1 DUF1295 domain-containing protein [Oligoflexia bacterium]
METLYKLLLVAEFVLAFFTFFTLYFIKAPYGRHRREGWGPEISCRAGWMIMELPAVVVIFCCFWLGNKQLPLVLFFLLWELHYLQRTFVFPLLMKVQRKTMPLLIVFFSIIFNLMNGFINGYSLFLMENRYLDLAATAWLYDPRFIFGTALFLLGFGINLHSDHVLRNLRKQGELDYKIPHAGLHRYVAAPNYLGEVIEWSGWALLTWSLPGLAFALFTIANLLPRAYAHLLWYRMKFADYPGERKALIPFVY